MRAVRLPAVALLLALASSAHGGRLHGALDPFMNQPPPQGPKLVADLAETVPKLFLDLVNDALRGKISSRSVRYEAPSSIVLEDAVLTDPDGALVARVSKARATLSLRALLSREIVISRIDVEEPNLFLELKNKKLNLIQALTPRKPPDKNKPPEAAFRIDLIRVDQGRFRFTDDANVTVTADGVDAMVRLEVDLARDVVLVDSRDVQVKSGAVMLPSLDVPLGRIRAEQVRVLTDRLEVVGIDGTAAGARVTGRGNIRLPEPGALSFHATVVAPPRAWPERLKPLPFELPALRADVELTGPYADPRVLVDATLEPGTAYGYSIDGAKARVEVTKDRVQVLDGTSLLAGGGKVLIDGDVALPSVAVALRIRAAGVPLARALEPAKLDPAPRGTIDARATVDGIADGSAPLRVQGTFGGHRAELAGVQLRGDVEGTARIAVEKGRVTLSEVTLRGDRVDARVSGDVLLDDERIALRVTARADDATALVPSVARELRLNGVTFEGAVAGPYKAVRVDGAARIERGSAWDVPLANVTGRVNAGAASVVVQRLQGTAASGTVNQTEDLVIQLKDKRSIRGAFSVENVDLALVQAAGPANADLPIAGRARAAVLLSGAPDDPVVDVRAAAGGVVVSDETLQDVVARLRITRKLLLVQEASVRGPLAHATTQGFRLGFPDLAMAGTVVMERLDLAAITATKRAELQGIAHGTMSVAGDVRGPVLSAHLQADDVVAGPQPFGSGVVELGLSPDEATPPPAKQERPSRRKLVARVAARLASQIGLWDVVTAYAIDRRVLNARVRITDVDLAPFTRRLGSVVAPLEGFLSGTVDASGPLEALSVRARLRVPEVAVATGGISTPERTDASAIPLFRPLGSLLLDATMDAGELAGRICAFPAGTPSPDAPCSDGERIWANVFGTVDLQEGNFDLSVNGQLEEHKVEDLFPTLAARGFAVGAKARVDAQLLRDQERTVEVRAQATLLEAEVQPPGSLRATLMSPTEVLYADRRVRLLTPARLVSPAREIDVAIAGEVGEEDIALDVEGTAALALLKLVTPQISSADGTANTKLAVRGRYASGIAIEGELTPSPGAQLTPRALGQSVVFESGRIRFAPTEASLLRVAAEELRARIGEGEAVLRGSVDVRTARSEDQPWVARWNLSGATTGLDVRFRDGRAEASADLSIIGDETTPLLRGRAEITDGSYRKNFELRNFVLSLPPEKESDPLWLRLTPVGLANLALDVDIALQNVRTRAHVADFEADLLLRGNLRLGKTLRIPEISGAIEVEEGTIDFPRARFDVTEMQVEFPPSGEGKLNPLLHLTARAEIPPGGAGTNDTEIPIDLSLDGDIDNGINLDLIATDPQREWARSELLGLILFGKSFENTVAERDASIAIRALMSEAAAPLTAELERLARETLGVAVEIDPSGWRWQLGRRLQLEGAGFLLQSGQDTTSAALPTGTTTNTAADAVRLRLLIVDHLALGKNLSLEGRTGSAGSDLRLSLRLLED